MSLLANPDVVAVLQSAAKGPVTVDFTTTGRRSALSRRIEIWFIYVEDRLIITGTPGERDWFANVHVNPEAILHIRTGRGEVDVPVRCTVISDPVRRLEVFEHPSAAWYRENSSTESLVTSAPMIQLEP